ncbi:unnamed protein product [Brassica rapa]|uniref:DUF4283 domain-containing protein n=1 Tax=Brassica campestris TaxID=3711 RepID=A0A3P6AZH8_BRACM|nr:unnamed protein product [Brassica rapa]VDC93393.1 unnamed protein product [Brassica rapa]
MARLSGVVKMSKASVAARSQKKSLPLAGESSADAVIVTLVTEEVPKSATVASPGSPGSDSCYNAMPSGVEDSDLPVEMEANTPTSKGEDNSAALQDSASASGEERDTHIIGGDKRLEGFAAPPAQNYANLLKASTQLEELGTPTEHVTGVPFVLIPDENIEAAKEEFKDFIYARFHGEFPAMGRIIGVINAIWAKSGPRIFVHNLGKGCYLLRVINPKAKEWLLSRTCWNIAGFPMFVAPWSPDFTPEEAPLTSAVVPVELRNVPYLLFNNQSLSRLATAIGKPDSLAPETERKENFEVAKLYVKVDLTKKLPTKIISGFSNGRECEISVSYPWLPVKCSVCGKHGHSDERCRLRKMEVSDSRRRERSVSVEKERMRQHSRPSRARDKKKTLQSPKENRAVDTALEEGEISLSANLEESTVPISKELPEASNLGSEELDGRGVNVGEPPANRSSGDTHLQSSASGHHDSPAEETEAPFLLVHGRKSGRRAKPHQ